MTSIIDCCFSQKINNYPRKNSQNKFQTFIKQISIKFKRKLVRLAKDSYCISLGTGKTDSKINYFTLLNIYQNNVNIMIIPYDTYGCMVRSKQNFNKNGWIRKHINENKNKFVKVNPLTGQAYFKYSYFIGQKQKVFKFWNQLLQKIAQIQSELNELMGKIMNNDCKQKPFNAFQEVIQTSKLVNSIKLSEIFKENVKIEDQFHRVNLQLFDKSHETTAFLQKTHDQNYFIQPQKMIVKQSAKQTLKSIYQEFLFFRRILDNQAIRIGTNGNTKTNVVGLTLTKQDQKNLNTLIRGIKFRQQVKQKINQINKDIFIQVKKFQDTAVSDIRKILSYLNRQAQYVFLDTYFQQIVFDDVILTLAIKQVPLTDYLWKNFQTISYQTKFRILIQTLNSVVTLWHKNQISFQNLNINSFTITKNLTVKLKKIQCARFIHPYCFQNEQAFKIYKQKKQTLKQFSNIYFEIFFNKKYPNIRYQKRKTRNQQEYQSHELIFQSINQLTKFYYPNNLFTLIIGLNYFFIHHYFRALEKVETVYKPDFNNMEFKYEKSFSYLEYAQRLDEAKKGKVRVDLVLTMIIQFLEQHSKKESEKGNEL